MSREKAYDSMMRKAASHAQRNIDVTFTRVGTWYITAPCGYSVEVQGAIPSGVIRQYAVQHKRACCKDARIVVETRGGYRELIGYRERDTG